MRKFVHWILIVLLSLFIATLVVLLIRDASEREQSELRKQASKAALRSTVLDFYSVVHHVEAGNLCPRSLEECYSLGILSPSAYMSLTNAGAVFTPFLASAPPETVIMELYSGDYLVLKGGGPCRKTELEWFKRELKKPK